MVDKDIVPFLGEKTARKRLRELDKEFASILVLIGIGFSKIFESIITILATQYQIQWFGLDFSTVVWWTLYTGFWVIVFIFELDKKVEESTDDVSEKAEEVTEKAEEVVEDITEE